MADEHVTASGPFFDGRLAAATRELQRDATHAVGQEALSEVHANMDASFRDPTPYYETQVEADQLAYDYVSVNDAGIIYGPWLEGTGSRNRTTRFKGYANFRRACQAVQNRVERVTARAVATFVAKVGG